MVIDHINGINNDNRLENLRFLCSNCNSQSSTFSGRNQKLKKPKSVKIDPLYGLIRKEKYLEDDLNRAFVANGHKTRGMIKKMIYTNSLLPRECSTCHLGEVWQDKPLMLVLDHINGINNDHRLKNLRLLCSNCNSQTSTFNGKNCSHASKALKSELIKQLPENPYAADRVVRVLGKRFRLTNEEQKAKKQEQIAKTKALHQSRQKHDWDNIDLLAMYNRIGSCLGIAKELGNISDVAVRKRLKKLGCEFNDQSVISSKTYNPRPGFKRASCF